MEELIVPIGCLYWLDTNYLSLVWPCRYLVYYIRSYAENISAPYEFAGFSLVCLLVVLIGLGKPYFQAKFFSFLPFLGVSSNLKMFVLWQEEYTWACIAQLTSFSVLFSGWWFSYFGWMFMNTWTTSLPRAKMVSSSPFHTFIAIFSPG